MPSKPTIKAKWQDPNLKVVFDVKAITKSLVPTRLSEIEQTQIDVIVSDGLMTTKKSLLKTVH
jgi:hypothetical protein